MQRDPRAWLWDARDASASIESFVSGLDLQKYAESELVHSAVERKFEVIGEALTSSPRQTRRLRRVCRICPKSWRSEIN